jgi:hypothetical protein
MWCFTPTAGHQQGHSHMHLLQAERFVIYGGLQRVLLYSPCLRLQLLSCLAACGGLRCTV